MLVASGETAGHDDLEHDHSHHKSAQADYYDHQQAAEFEIERPNSSPLLYRWLMREKFRRSMSDLTGHFEGRENRIALTVCGGSGMEAQFLAECGFDVVASDLSLGAAQRCRERARRFRLPIVSIVADAERLPFADRSVPLVYVHDGLHHLEDPLSGLSEMARVAGVAISITEPARAAVTGLAVRLGLADAVEAAGNRVARLEPGKVEALLRRLDFEVVHSRRYAMYYRHHPGQVVRFLSHPPLMPFAQGGLRIANLAAGRWGNKLAVSARRQTVAVRREG